MATSRGQDRSCAQTLDVRAQTLRGRARPNRRERGSLSRALSLEHDADGAPAAGPPCYPLSRIPKRDHLRLTSRAAAIAAFVLPPRPPPALRAEERVTIVWKGESAPRRDDRRQGVPGLRRGARPGLRRGLRPGNRRADLTGYGHQILVGPGTAQVPVDRRIVPISSPARVVAGALYAPTDFFEKILFPLAGAAGGWDSGRKTWTLTAAGPPPVSVEVAVGPRRTHDPGRAAAVLGGARASTTASEKSFQVRFPETRLDPPFRNASTTTRWSPRSASRATRPRSSSGSPTRPRARTP